MKFVSRSTASLSLVGGLLMIGCSLAGEGERGDEEVSSSEAAMKPEVINIYQCAGGTWIGEANGYCSCHDGYAKNASTGSCEPGLPPPSGPGPNPPGGGTNGGGPGGPPNPCSPSGNSCNYDASADIPPFSGGNPPTTGKATMFSVVKAAPAQTCNAQCSKTKKKQKCIEAADKKKNDCKGNVERFLDQCMQAMVDLSILKCTRSPAIGRDGNSRPTIQRLEHCDLQPAIGPEAPPQVVCRPWLTPDGYQNYRDPFTGSSAYNDGGCLSDYLNGLQGGGVTTTNGTTKGGIEATINVPWVGSIGVTPGSATKGNEVRIDVREQEGYFEACSKATDQPFLACESGHKSDVAKCEQKYK